MDEKTPLKLLQWNLSNPTHQDTKEMCRIVQDVGIYRFKLVNSNTLESWIFVGCHRISENSGVGLHKFHYINILNEFSKISGLKLNLNKSELIPLGHSKVDINTHNFSPGIKITTDKFKLLRIIIPTNGKQKDLIEEN